MRRFGLTVSIFRGKSLVQRPIGHRRIWTACWSLCWAHPIPKALEIPSAEAVRCEVFSAAFPELKHEQIRKTQGVQLPACLGTNPGF
jgi:hypothetical protein